MRSRLDRPHMAALAHSLAPCLPPIPCLGLDALVASSQPHRPRAAGACCVVTHARAVPRAQLLPYCRAARLLRCCLPRRRCCPCYCRCVATPASALLLMLRLLLLPLLADALLLVLAVLLLYPPVAALLVLLTAALSSCYYVVACCCS